MFAKAYDIVKEFTRPVIVSYRTLTGVVSSSLGSFVILNDEGWIMTAAHILDPFIAANEQQPLLQKYSTAVHAIQKLSIDRNEKTKRIAEVPRNDNWITNCSFWWGENNSTINTFHILKENDFAIGKIIDYKGGLKNYPVLKTPGDLKFGTSLCKLGYPFHEVQTSFDEYTGSFSIDPSIFPIPRFPLDGMFTREANAGKSKDGKYDLKFIETSTPGLRGQSGGPTFDTEGRVWAIQSQTRHLPLGFAPRVLDNGKEVTENQFLNVGFGVHVEVIKKFLDDFDIKYQLG